MFVSRSSTESSGTLSALCVFKLGLSESRGFKRSSISHFIFADARPFCITFRGDRAPLNEWKWDSNEAEVIHHALHYKLIRNYHN